MPLTAGTSLLSALKPSPEEKLVIACARLKLTQAQQDGLNALLDSHLRWDEVVNKALWHNLAALVFYHLGRLEKRGCVPTEAMSQLKAVYLANVARNLYFQAELRRAVAALRAQNVPVILLKGAALAGTVYQDPGQRPMSDLDLLVPETQVFAAQAIIQGLGYLPVGSVEEQEDTEKHHRHLPGLAGIDKPVLFEVHRHIVRRDSALHFDIEGFWARAQEVSVAGTSALVLAPEDLLIHLTLNFFLDRRFRSMAALRQLCDITESITYYQSSFCWQDFVDRVRAYHLSGPVGCSLYLAQQLLEAPVPDSVLSALAPVGLRPRQTERLVRQRILGDEWVAKSLVPPGAGYHWWTIPVAVLRRVFPDRRHLVSRYNMPDQSKRVYRLYLRSVSEALAIAVRLVIKPGEMRDDLAVDRWLHSLYPRHRMPGPRDRSLKRNHEGVNQRTF